MPNDINTKDDIKYVRGSVGSMIAYHQKQVNIGERHHTIDVEVRNTEVGDQYNHHGNIPYEAFHDAMLELAQQYPAPTEQE